MDSDSDDSDYVDPPDLSTRADYKLPGPGGPNDHREAIVARFKENISDEFLVRESFCTGLF